MGIAIGGRLLTYAARRCQRMELRDGRLPGQVGDLEESGRLANVGSPWTVTAKPTVG